MNSVNKILFWDEAAEEQKRKKNSDILDKLPGCI